MKKKTYKNIRKFLYASLFSLVILSLVIGFGGVISERIDYTNTWQYHAEYDFEQVLETNENGENTLVLKVGSPQQLAGAFNALRPVTIVGLEGPDGSTIPGPSRPGTGGSGSTSSSTNVDINSSDSYISGIEEENKVIRLTKNINFKDYSSKYKWTPAELKSGYTFDGAGFVISGLSITSSAENIGFVSKNNGTIKNVVFQGATVYCSVANGGKHNTGVVAGINETTGVIENVSVIGNSTVTGNTNTKDENNASREIGGIVGKNSGKISYCINKATVKYGKHVGGIAGYNSGTVEKCYNYGDVSANESTYKTKFTRVGGIIGELASGGKISLCQNHGTIKGDSSNTDGNNATGGVVGYANGNVTQCANYGDVTGGTTSTNISNVGGIVGYTNSNVENSYNLGTIKALAVEKSSNSDAIKYNSSDPDYRLDQFTDDQFYIGIYNQWRKHTYFLCPGPKGNTQESVGRVVYKTSAYAGGIVGAVAESSDNVKNCYNTGSVTGGKTEYKDTYAYVLLYEQYHQQITIPLGYTKYGRHATRVYYSTMRYTYETYDSPIVGSCGGVASTAMLATNIGTKSYTKDASFDYSAKYYYYYNEGFNPWSFLGGIGIIAGVSVPVGIAVAVGVVNGLTLAELFDKEKLKETQTKSDSSAASTTWAYDLITIHSNDDDPFDIYAAKERITKVKQYYKVDATNNKAYVSMRLKINGTDCSYDLGDISLNQVVSADTQYTVYSAADLKNCTTKTASNTLGTTYWAQNSAKNDGYPYLKGMYW